MEDTELRQRLDALDKKINDAFVAADKTRKYMMWAGIISIALFVLPLIGLAFAIPSFISTYSQLGGI